MNGILSYNIEAYPIAFDSNIRGPLNYKGEQILIAAPSVPLENIELLLEQELLLPAFLNLSLEILSNQEEDNLLDSTEITAPKYILYKLSKDPPRCHDPHVRASSLIRAFT